MNTITRYEIREIRKKGLPNAPMILAFIILTFFWMAFIAAQVQTAEERMIETKARIIYETKQLAPETVRVQPTLPRMAK